MYLVIEWKKSQHIVWIVWFLSCFLRIWWLVCLTSAFGIAVNVKLLNEAKKGQRIQYVCVIIYFSIVIIVNLAVHLSRHLLQCAAV